MTQHPRHINPSSTSMRELPPPQAKNISWINYFDVFEKSQNINVGESDRIEAKFQ